MLGFVVRRLLYLVPVLVAVSLLTFLIASLLPGDLAYVILGDQATPEKVAALRHDMGLDQPIWWRYLSWLGHVLQGDFGRSFRTGQTVLQAVTERLPVSLELMILAEIIGLAVGVPLAEVGRRARLAAPAIPVATASQDQDEDDDDGLTRRASPSRERGPTVVPSRARRG